ncbi:hypothetical protein ES703_72910 [subsurface metagenome]
MTVDVESYLVSGGGVVSGGNLSPGPDRDARIGRKDAPASVARLGVVLVEAQEAQFLFLGYEEPVTGPAIHY